MMLRLTESESKKIVLEIAPVFHAHLKKFSAGKYPDEDYERFLTDFADPARVGEPTIRSALLWKYGHWNKSNFPERHDALIRRIADLWPGLVATLPVTPSAAFTYLHMNSGVPYVSSAFLVHLLFPAEMPIIDQHNFRAMNHFVKWSRPAWTYKKTPSNYGDLINLKAFMREIVGNWSSVAHVLPSERDLDKFLMAFGKSIKC